MIKFEISGLHTYITSHVTFVLQYNKVLVTGGAGFLGSYLCEILRNLGKEVVIFDNGFRVGFSNYDPIKNRATLIKGNITNADDWKKIPADVDFVFHLGAINGTRYFYEIPDEVLRVNIQGTFNMLDWIRKTSAKSFFFASSSEVYGFPKKFPTSEMEEISIPDPKNPRFSYSSSKIVGEILSINFAKKYGLDYRIGRFHNVYGPRMGFEHVIPEFIRRITLDEGFVVQGDGTESRCFCYISDAVDAILLISDLDRASNDIFNIGTQEETTINGLIMVLEKIVKKKITPIYKSFSNPGTRRRVPDISKLAGIGYKPKVSIEDGLTKTFHWYQKWWLEHKNSK